MAQKETQVTNAPMNLEVLSGDVKQAIASMPMKDRVTFLRKVSEYVGADTEDTNKYLNVEFGVKGVLIHTATVNKESKETLNQVTGEITQEPVYIEADRVVFKLENDKVLGFVSMSITSYVRDYLIPAFGMGDWIDPETGEALIIKMKITQVTSRGGRAYSIQIV